ncbi:MAG: hypothetical protein C5B45_03260 [Chlamydiae bacterium]|nr:MAG: hypothetical protein C5B45_03260 [Chlamydiota bacterium]
MTPAYDFQIRGCIHDWLIRVDTQYDQETPEKVKKADSACAEQTLQDSKIYNIFFSSSPMFSRPQPAASRGWFSSGDTNTANNSYNTTHIHNTTHVYNASVGSSSDFEEESVKDAKGAKEKKTDWKAVAALGVVSTAVAGISIFVYARLSKATEGAINYLENTKRVQQWSMASSDSNISTINRIAQTQTQIDQRAVDKITNYKYSILTSLVGTLAVAGGGITILTTAAPLFATAGTAAVVAGGVLNSIAVIYAAYNCGMHWSDEEDGKKSFNGVRSLIPDLLKAFNPNTQPQNYYIPATPQQSGSFYSYNLREYSEHFEEERTPPPSYDASQEAYQAIYNQRAKPGIYPDLSEFKPSAPPYGI